MAPPETRLRRTQFSMTKQWRLKKKISDNLVDQLLKNRGIEDKERFFEPQYGDLYDPFLFKDMVKAVERIKKAKNITIFADYDADGVTAAALLSQILDVRVYIPDRNKEGYGLNCQAIKKVAGNGSDLIITVDCGVSDFEEVELARKLGVDVIITDHHHLPSKLPRALAIINPKQRGYPFKDLAGVGVAFKLAQALLGRRGRGQPSPSFEKWLLDLVAIGTITDCMPLLDENRVLAKFGLIVLAKTKRIGLQRLLPSKLDAHAVAFQIGPRLNAAGRMDQANTAYQLLITTSGQEAQTLASHLEEKNRERQTITVKIFDELAAKFDSQKKLIFDGSEDFPVGVIGLVAGKLADTFFRPTIIFSQGKEKSIGSARSIPSFNIIQAIEKCGYLLEEYGGHPGAAGFTILNKNLRAFQKYLDDLCQRQLKEKDLIPILEIDAQIKPDDIAWDLCDEIQKFAPFGYGNPKPRFLLSNVQIQDIWCVGNNGCHLKLRVPFEVIGFNFGSWADKIKAGDYIDLVFELETDQWNGLKKLQLNLIDLRRHE